MEKENKKLKVLVKEIITSVTKHKAVLINAFLATVFAIAAIIGDFDSDICVNLGLAFGLSTFMAIPCSYLTAKSKKINRIIIQVIVSAVSVAVGFCILNFIENQSYKDMIYSGIFSAVICLIVMIFIPAENSKAYYANILKNSLFCELLCTVGFLGCVLLVFAFSNLIYEIDDFFDLAAIIGCIWYILISINLFNYYLNEKREEPSGKAFKVIFLNILFPIYGFLLLILYLYLLKALFTLSLPNGQINWFVSFATVFYLVFYFIFREYEDKKIIKLFYKFGAWVLLPLIFIQFAACFIRINKYGFTGWRYSSILYNIFALIFVICTLIKNGKFTKYAIPVLGLFILVGSVTPLNVINVSYRSQYKKMIKVLEKNDLLTADNNPDISDVEKVKAVSEEDKEILKSAYEYLRYKSDHKKPEWLLDDSLEYFNTSEDDLTNDSSEDEYIYYENYSSENQTINVSGYSTMKILSVHEYDLKTKEILVPDTRYDLAEKLLSLAENDKKDSVEIIIDGNTKVIMYNIHFDYDKTEEYFTAYGYDYYLLKK